MAAMETNESGSGPTMNQVFKRFIVSDLQNTQTVAFEAFNSMSNDLAVAGPDAGVDVRFDDGIITLSEVFLVCGFQLPELPVSVNQLATVFRQIDGGTGTVDFVSFLRQLEYSVEYEGNPEDEQVTFEQAIAKVAGPLCPLKLNTLKDSIRRWSKEGNGRIDSTELRQFARFFELNIESDAETLGLKELLPLVISDQSKAYYQTPLDMDEMMKAFEWCDVDHTGKLSSDQLAKAMRLAGHNPSQGEFRKLKAEMDLNRDGVFDFDEFTEICCASYVTPDEMRRKTMAAFHVFDTEKTGRITVDGLRRIFSTYGEDMSPEEMDAIFRELGLDEAGNMDVGELVTLLLS